jgi:YD repeat-containing protein
VAGQRYTYDANGNYTAGPSGSAAWNTDNQPTSLTANGLTEQFTYDADGERLSRTHGGLTTYSLQDRPNWGKIGCADPRETSRVVSSQRFYRDPSSLSA